MGLTFIGAQGGYKPHHASKMWFGWCIMGYEYVKQKQNKNVTTIFFKRVCAKPRCDDFFPFRVARQTRDFLMRVTRPVRESTDTPDLVRFLPDLALATIDQIGTQQERQANANEV
jgi:hypothetical protein